jgi:hypothetical protein
MMRKLKVAPFAPDLRADENPRPSSSQSRPHSGRAAAASALRGKGPRSHSSRAAAARGSPPPTRACGRSAAPFSSAASRRKAASHFTFAPISSGAGGSGTSSALRSEIR